MISTTTKAAFQKLDDYGHLDTDGNLSPSDEKQEVSKMKVEMDKINSNANKMNELMQPQSKKNKGKWKIIFCIHL